MMSRNSNDKYDSKTHNINQDSDSSNYRETNPTSALTTVKSPNAMTYSNEKERLGTSKYEKDSTFFD
jgi:hypothetical protein